VNDAELIQGVCDNNNQSRSMDMPVHLFKLAKLNSEIKYVANSIVRDVPTYAYPPIRDVSAWQSSMLKQLDDWAAAIPHSQPPNEFIRLTFELRCLSVKMLLLRPSPAIPNPTSAVLTSCHASARHSLQLYEKLYKNDLIVHDWITLHGVVFSIITVLYCTRAVPEIAQKVAPEELMEDMSVSLSILSAIGEHWSGAKRARDIMEDVGRKTIRWLRRNCQISTQRQTQGYTESDVQFPQLDVDGNTQMEQSMSEQGTHYSVPGLTPNLDFFSGFQLDQGLFPELQQRQEPFGDTVNLDDMMRNLFDDFIPSGQNFY
jgi:hypothetical protein